MGQDIILISDNPDSSTTCNGLFYDSGGSGGDYSSNENHTQTICPDVAGALISVEFINLFRIRNGDFLTIYDGSSAASTSLGTYNQSNSAQGLTFTATNECLTFVFTSNNNTNRSGWEAVVSCIISGPEITISDPIENEDNGTIDFVVTVSELIPGGFSVDYDTANDTADGSDFTADSGTLNFSATDLTQTISINITTDSIVEADETFFIDLSNAVGGSVSITDNQGFGTITDGTICTGTFTDSGGAAGDYSNSENITYTICPDTPGSFSIIEFTDFFIEDGWDFMYIYDGDSTAIGDQIGVYTNTDLDGVTITSTVGCLTVVFDSDNTVTRSGWEANVSCTSNDPQISIDDVTEDEDNGTIIFTVSHTGTTTNGSFTVDYTSNDNTAEAPDDYLSQSGTLTFVGTSLSTQTISIPIINDNFAEIAEIFTVDLSNLIINDPSDTDLSIADNEGIGTINESDSTSIAVTSISVNEDIGTATYTATLTGGDILGGFTIEYDTTDNTAIAGGDYESTSGVLTFLGNEGETQTFTIPIIDNSYGESDETFFIILSNASSALLNVTITSTQTIIDDGDPAIPSDVPLTLFNEFNGYYDYALTAGSLRTQDNNTDPCAITTTSSNTLTTEIPVGSTIERAYLIWAHSGFTPDDIVTFEGQTVAANVIYSFSSAYYGMIGDVTSIINSIEPVTNNNYDFTDLNIDNGPSFCGTTVMGGWSLMVFYSNPTLPAVSINMYYGFDFFQNEDDDFTLDGFYAIGNNGSKTSILSWEGDANISGNENISVTTGVGTAVLNGDGDNTGTTENVFNSTIYDDTGTTIINDSSLYGFDLDTYDISSYIAQGESSATTTVEAGGDLIFLNTVLLKVPSNLITGTVFEDVNYPGGSGRDLTTSNGVGIEGVTVELYDNTGTYLESDITDVNGVYNLGGMENGTYSLRVVNSTVQSTRGGGDTCATCIPVQTFRSQYASSTLTPITDEVGGADPTATDTAVTILAGAQTVSTITIVSEGAVDVDFGFNFNTIVNTNESGQGSLEQFIINSNELDETGLNIEAHPNDGTLNHAAGEDVSIFMIPTSSDPLSRPADARFNGSGYFDILISNSAELSSITDDNTHIDGRTQTAYSGDTNTGTAGSGGTNVGTSGTALPNYNQPEIQIRQNNGVDPYVLNIEANNVVIRNAAIYANVDAGIRMTSGSSSIIENFIGINANGGFVQNIEYGIEIVGGSVNIDSNYIADNTDAGIFINGGTSTTIQNNHITQNGSDNCKPNIQISSGTGILIQQNLIESSEATGIKDNFGGATITENTIINSGTNVACTENSGIRLENSNTTISNTVINNSAGSGIFLTGGNTSGNTITQNSIYANGTLSDALGIDIDSSGVTLNDNGDTDTGPNGVLNFPVIERAIAAGNELRISGWSSPGAIIEFFLTDINQGTASTGDNQLGLTKDYGEGQIYLGSAVEGSIDDTDGTTSAYSDVDGSSDDTNKFNFTISLSSSIPVGSIITATATLAGSTSEFVSGFTATGISIITNRFLPYRVTPTNTAPSGPGIPTGTLTSDITLNSYNDNGSFNIGGNISAPMNNWEILIAGVQYSSLPTITNAQSNGNNLTLTSSTKDNGNGTYDILITVSGFSNFSFNIGGNAPSPNGSNSGTVTFYFIN